MDTPEAVARIAAILANAEDASDEISTEFAEIPSLLKSIYDNGDGGYLVTRSLATAAEALIADFRAGLFELHRNMTLEADAAGVDVPPPAAKGAQPLSGGGR
jgi:hypothetical protein